MWEEMNIEEVMYFTQAKIAKHIYTSHFNNLHLDILVNVSFSLFLFKGKLRKKQEPGSETDCPSLSFGFRMGLF